MKYAKRIAAPTLMRYLKAFPAVGVTGPRQSGKSTLLQYELPDYRYVTFDDPRNIEIKKTHTFRVNMTTFMEQCLHEGDRAYLLYQGNCCPYKDNIHVIN